LHDFLFVDTLLFVLMARARRLWALKVSNPSRPLQKKGVLGVDLAELKCWSWQGWIQAVVCTVYK
jgi:hypothetical protein